MRRRASLGSEIVSCFPVSLRLMAVDRSIFLCHRSATVRVDRFEEGTGAALRKEVTCSVLRLRIYTPDLTRRGIDQVRRSENDLFLRLQSGVDDGRLMKI